ncbi:hypothetical protein [Allomesorhizobium alhagi]|uniref:Uncharacterized protein n=1 Tax=Mesorhizobium alhagi CCNWXJ12-2 TaxID=1107882 RepID=H0HR13_9HYPH|nr:hypothetical protein [Mesorhizobium alhagi]EHK56875.1 hypothetical protein MAXJ12_12977 [Mesorhizobium alhagi CCNWXJ12-2]
MSTPKIDEHRAPGRITTLAQVFNQKPADPPNSQNNQQKDGDRNQNSWWLLGDFPAQAIMAWMAVIAVILTGIGLYFLRRTLVYTRDAAEHSKGMLIEAQKVTAAELEPFFTIEVKEGDYFKDGIFNPSELSFQIKNQGRSVGIVHTIYQSWHTCDTGNYPEIVTPPGTHASEHRVKPVHIPIGASELSPPLRMTPNAVHKPDEGQSVYFYGYFLSRNLAGDEFEDVFLWVFIRKNSDLGMHLAVPRHNAQHYNYHRKKTA